MKVIVYTANIGGYDKINSPITPEPYTFLYYSDFTEMAHGWRRVDVSSLSGDGKRDVQKIKILSHDLPEHDVSLWIDASFAFLDNISPLIDQFIQSGHNIAAPRHRHRNCTYKEIEACIKLKKDNASILKQHASKYKRKGFPKNSGMIETGILLRRNNESVRSFNEIWHKEICEGSKRDQVSVIYAAMKSGVNIDKLPFTVNSNPYFKLQKHK